MTVEEEFRALDEAANFSRLPHALGRPEHSGVIRARPEDFSVREVLPFEPQGDGEHLYLCIRKTAQNTRWVARHLARVAAVAPRAVGWAGLKDRHAVAEQWFSLYLPGSADPDALCFEAEGIEVLAMTRHSRKLRVGMVAANCFDIVIRDLDGPPDALAQRVDRLMTTGAPNFFGPQRFGRARGNLRWFGENRPDSLIGDRSARSFGLSALRSSLFNGYLARRITAGDWTRVLPGEIGYRPAARDFRANVAGIDEDTLQPTGLLWGEGTNQASDEGRRREDEYFAGFPRATAVLEQFETRMSRRSLIVRPRDLHWQMLGDSLKVRFTLGRGSFATSVLRELIHCEDRGQAPSV